MKLLHFQMLLCYHIREVVHYRARNLNQEYTKEIRALREICRYRYKLICMRSCERNRYQNWMTVSNIGLASVVSDPFGKTTTAIMQEVLSSDIIDDSTILKLSHGSCKNKDKILDSLKDSKIETD